MKLPAILQETLKSLAAELIGTSILVFVGCGVVLHQNESDKPSIIGIALCWGFTVGTLVQMLGHTSGCHLNPAVTLAMVIIKKIEIVKAALYIVVQCAGATIGICVLKAVSSERALGGFGVITVARELTAVQGFAIEFILTFILLFLVCSLVDENRTDLKSTSPALVLAICVSTLVLYGGPLTGAGFNPARTLGPAIVNNKWKDHWVYLAGPIGGAVLAALMYKYIFSVRKLQQKNEIETPPVYTPSQPV